MSDRASFVVAPVRRPDDDDSRLAPLAPRSSFAALAVPTPPIPLVFGPRVLLQCGNLHFRSFAGGSMLIRCLVVWVGLVALLCASSASADFSIDAISPDVPGVGEGDVLLPGGGSPPPLIVMPAGVLGLILGEELDALSTGVDTICPAGNPNCYTIITYSVDRAAVGLVGSQVAGQVAGNGAAGDIFKFEVSGTAVIITPPSVDTDALLNDLTIVPESNIDALSTGKALVPAMYFSVDPAALPGAGVRWAMPGLSAADILVGPGPTPTIYSTAVGLGLVAGDDIDGMAISDSTPFGTFSAGDVVYVTLAPGSPSLTTIPASPGDIIQVAPGSPAVIYPAALMGLAPADNLSAISMIDPPLASPVPSIGTAGTVSIALLFATLGGFAIWRRREVGLLRKS